MILAAGRGQRLRPISDVLPKPAIPLPGGPLITWPLRIAAACGVRRAVVNTSWLAEAMEDAARSASVDNLEITFSREKSLMDTAGGLALARDRGLLGTDGPILVVNGDGILNLDLEPLFARHAQSDDEVTLALIPHLDPQRWSRVTLDSLGRVAGIKGKGSPEANEVPFLFPGVMLVARTALEALPPGPSAIPETLWAPAADTGRLGGVVVTGHWRELGTPADYLDATVALLGDRNTVDSTATVDERAKIVHSFIGPGASVASDAVIGESIVSHGAQVAPGTRVIRSILLGPVGTGADETLADEHLCHAILHHQG